MIVTTYKISKSKKKSCQLFEPICVSVQHTTLPIPVEIICKYVSQKFTFKH